MFRYQILSDDYKKIGSRTLYRIRAQKSFVNKATNNPVEKGELGGYIEGYENLDCNSFSTAWVFPNCHVYDVGYVGDDAAIMNGVLLSGNSVVRQNASVYGKCIIDAYSVLSGDSKVVGESGLDTGGIKCLHSLVAGDAILYGEILIRYTNVSCSCMIGGKSASIVGTKNNHIYIPDEGKIFLEDKTITDSRQLTLFY